MKREKIYKFMLFAAALLLVGFLIRVAVDCITYNPTATSFPLYATVLVRSLEFLLPSLVLLIIALILKHRTK